MPSVEERIDDLQREIPVARDLVWGLDGDATLPAPEERAANRCLLRVLLKHFPTVPRADLETKAAALAADASSVRRRYDSIQAERSALTALVEQIRAGKVPYSAVEAEAEKIVASQPKPKAL